MPSSSNQEPRQDNEQEQNKKRVQLKKIQDAFNEIFTSEQNFIRVMERFEKKFSIMSPETAPPEDKVKLVQFFTSFKLVLKNPFDNHFDISQAITSLEQQFKSNEFKNHLFKLGQAVLAYQEIRNELEQNHSSWVGFVNEVEDKISQPFQRITRYPMLLSNLLEQLNSDELLDEYSRLNTLFENIDELVKEFNSFVPELDNKKKDQSLLYSEGLRGLFEVIWAATFGNESTKNSIELLNGMLEKHKGNKELIKSIIKQLNQTKSLEECINSIDDNPKTKNLKKELKSFIRFSVHYSISDKSHPKFTIKILERRCSYIQKILQDFKKKHPSFELGKLSKCLGVFVCGLIGLAVLTALTFGIYCGITVICPPAGVAIAAVMLTVGITKASLIASAAGFLLGFLPGACVGHNEFFGRSVSNKFLKANLGFVERKGRDMSPSSR
jgi:hypothetical protein